MFDDRDHGDRRDERDGAHVELGEADAGQANPCGLGDGREIHHAERHGDRIAHDDGEQHRHRADDAAAPGKDHRREQRDGGDQGALRVEHRCTRGVGTHKGHVGGGGGQTHADDHHDGGNEHGRQQAVKPARADELDDARHHEEHCARHNHTGHGGVETARGAHREDGADEGERAAQIAGNLVAGHEQVADGADARAHDGDVGIEAGQHGYEHRGAEHAHHVLDSQRNGARRGDPVVDADDLAFAVAHGRSFL